ncbi:acyl-CoA dehydrogenase family protein [bacterium]|nr:acyl-CoA dehydrogenase family protein [bacterium]
MDFDLNENHKMIQNMVREFAQNEIKPGAAERDESREFPMEICKKLGELGLMGLTVEEKFGGSEMDVTSFAIVVEEVAKVDGSVALTIASHNGLCCGHISLAGNDEQKQKYLPKLASAEHLGAWCLTEPDSGSDALAMKTTATLDGDDYIINGSKMFITQGSVAQTYVVITNTIIEGEDKGPSAFVVERNSSGLTPGKPEDKLGLKSSDTASVSFDNVRVSKANLLGEVGQGFKDALKILDKGRVVIGAMALGLGKAALEEATKYSIERTAFGKPISKFQAIQWKLADAATELEVADVLLKRASSLHDQKKYAKKESSMAKLYASEAAWRACNMAIQVHGGYGYVSEYPVERFYRDVKLCEIGEGTSQIQREVISREILK